MERRIGPLPLWGWVVVAIAAYLVWRRRTEAGYFPGASFSVAGSSGTGGGVRSFLGLPVAPSEPEEEPSGSALFIGGGGSRPTLPTPITAGGPDGSVPSGSGGTLAAASAPSTQEAGTATVYGTYSGVAPKGTYTTGLQGTLGGARAFRRRAGSTRR